MKRPREASNLREHDPITIMQLIEWPYYRIEFLASQGLSPTFVRRFWEKVTITDGCWIWTAATHEWGYGVMQRGRAGRGVIKAHIASWIIHFGHIPIGMNVLHHCDNPPCIRPQHLFLGTISDNTQDMISKGRGLIGTKNGQCKLTDVDVVLIRKYRQSGASLNDLAEQFGVSFSNICSICTRASWRHI